MIAQKTWREVRLMAFVYMAVLQLMLTPAVLLWPELKDGIAILGRAVPMQMIRDMVQAMTDRNPEVAYRAYMAVQIFFKGVNVVGIASAILLGTGLISRERENHTLEFLLARPVGRSQLLWSKCWVVALCLVIPIFLTTWTAIPLSWCIQLDLPFWPLTIGCIYSSLFVLTFFTLTVLASVVCRTQGHVAFLVGVFVIVQVGLLFLPAIHVASVFHLSDFQIYGPILAGNVRLERLMQSHGIWLLLAIAGLYVGADRALRRLEL